MLWCHWLIPLYYGLMVVIPQTYNTSYFLSQNLCRNQISFQCYLPIIKMESKWEGCSPAFSCVSMNWVSYSKSRTKTGLHQYVSHRCTCEEYKLRAQSFDLTVRCEIVGTQCHPAYGVEFTCLSCPPSMCTDSPFYFPYDLFEYDDRRIFDNKSGTNYFSTLACCWRWN